MADAHDVNDKSVVAYLGNHPPIADAVLPESRPCAGQRPSELARIGRANKPLVDESLNALLDRSIKRGELVARRRMKLNGPGQAAS